MKKFMKHSLLLLLCSAVFVPRMHAVTKVVPNTGGGASSGQTFQEVAQAAAFHRPSGTMVFGLGKAGSMDALGFAATTVTAGSAGSPATGDTVPTYTGIAQTALAAGLMNIQNSSIQALAIANDITNPTNFSKAKIFFISSQGNNDSLATSNVGHPLMVITTTAIPSNPNALKVTDANSTAACCYTMTVVAGNAYGSSNNKTYAFVAVKDNDGHDANRGNFGAHAGDGVVMVECGDDDYTLTQRDKAIATTLNITTSLATGQLITGNVVGQNGRTPAMCYDETLKRLYVGVNYTTSQIPSHNTGGWGIQILKVDPDTSNGTFTELLPGGATANMGTTVLTGSHIVGVGSGGTGSGSSGTRASLTYHNLEVMHTSAGPADGTKFAYLIVNGGNGHGNSSTTAGSVGVSNRVWAVPLVVGASSSADDGRFANVKTGKYNTVADAAGELFLTNTAAVRVGNGPLPCSSLTKPSAMWVDGDAVYCSIDAAASSTDCPGIWQSQACFNRHGQIDHWTEWRRISPLNLGYNATNTSNGRISFFAVDAATTRLWGVDTTKKLLRLTTWSTDSYDANTTAPAQDTTGLIYNINSASHLNNNIISVCDLNSSTTGWGATTPMRLTMFGNSAGKVSWAITGSARGYSAKQGVVASANTLVQTNTAIENNVTFDYSLTGTLKTTTVISGAHITCLAYSGWDERASSLNTGYFFAGVQDPNNSANNGVYVWTLASLGAGFDTRDVQGLNMPPFRGTTDTATSPRSWQKLTRLPGTPKKIVARGGAVYVLTREGSANTDRIHRITRKSTAAEMNYSLCVTATAGATPSTGETLPAHIYDFTVTATALSSETSGAQSAASTVYGEQLMMLTIDGLYTTTCSIGVNDWNIGKNPNSAQLMCGWTQLNHPETDGTWQHLLSTPDYTRDPSTFWFERSVYNSTDDDYLSRNFYQLSRVPLSVKRAGGSNGTNDGGTWGNWAYNPSSFNAYDGTSTTPTAFSQEPFACTSFSDGSRRIKGIFNLDNDNYALTSQPYEVGTKTWNVASASTNTLYNEYTHWTSTAGNTGKVLAGTKIGLIGLI